jgi:IPT/TIG domain
MKFRLVPCLSLLLFLGTAMMLQSQTTLSEQTANNTAGCSDGSSHCQAGYVGMSDSSSGTYNAVPGKISLEDLHEMEYSGATTAIYAHFMPWFCMQAGSTATGVGTACNGHYQVGYNSNSAGTVKAQMDDMQRRGIRGPIIDWYGPNASIEEGTTQKVKADLEARCSGGTCPMQFAITEDQGSIGKSCPQNGGGTDQTSCISKALQNDLDYMNTNYFPSPAYLRVDATTMRPQAGARPAVFFFICESCYTNPSPNWTLIFQQLRQHVMSYTTGDPLIWFIFRNSGAFTHVESDGGFAWVNHYGSNDPYGLVYLDNFYDTSLKYSKLQPWGSAWKGFDNTNAPWKPAVSITPQQCGNTWVQTFAEMTHNNDYSASHQLPFLQLVTWNDYDEGTEIETGIGNCMSLSASTDGTNLSWTPTFSGSGNENTVHHYEVYDSPDGSTLNQVATVPAGTHAIPLSSMNLSSGSHTFFVEAVGKPSIQNKMSTGVAYTPGTQVTVTAISPVSGTTSGGTAVTISGTNFQTGATVTIGGLAATVTAVSATSISATTPAHSAGAVDVTVTNSDSTTATLANGYTYVAPVVSVTGVSPNSGPAAGGTAVTISGTNFQAGAKVTFGGTLATITGVNPTSISAMTPAHVAGTVSVTVTNSDGTGATRSSGYTYVAPTFVLSASPTSRTVSRGTTATYSISLSPKNGYTGRVNFSVSGLPSGATASFSPSYVTTSGSTTLSVGTRSSSRGTFTLTAKGTSSTGLVSSTVKVTLVVR